MSLYPPKVSRRAFDPEHAVTLDSPNATGTAVSFECGCFVRFQLRVDDESQIIEAAGYKSNGCGYMIAAAEVLADRLQQANLRDLHGLDKNEILGDIEKRLTRYHSSRVQCAEVPVHALKSTLADYRSHRIEEFQGEKALICTCFGVSEETITRLIEENRLTEVADVSALSNAGSGCGSCQMLIQEMIDGAIFGDG